MAGASRKIEMDKKVIQAGRYDNKSTAEERDEFLVSPGCEKAGS
jgi:ATP-dependent helicase STH1/SNF2